jgi:hypothetical protein
MNLHPLTPSLSPNGGEGVRRLHRLTPSLSPAGGEDVRRTGEGKRIWARTENLSL